jgi:hypothetical protein
VDIKVVRTSAHRGRELGTWMFVCASFDVLWIYRLWIHRFAYRNSHPMPERPYGVIHKFRAEDDCTFKTAVRSLPAVQSSSIYSALLSAGRIWRVGSSNSNLKSRKRVQFVYLCVNENCQPAELSWYTWEVSVVCFTLLSYQSSIELGYLYVTIAVFRISARDNRL